MYEECITKKNLQNASRILLSIYSKYKVRLVTSINSEIWNLK